MKIKQKIIKLLADYPEREFYGQEIARKLKCSKASASNVLKLLEKKKVVFRSDKGHMKFYQINRKSSELKKFRISEAIEGLNPILRKLKKNSQKIILFGSASRGEQTEGSDVDLFILSDKKEEVRKILSGLDYKAGIKAIIKNFSEWSEMEIKEPELYHEIKNGIILHEYVPRI